MLDKDMEPVNFFEVKNKLSHYVSLAEHGSEVVITRHGRPVAKFVPVMASQRPLGALKGRVKMHGDFDAPLPDDIREAFGA